jgi:hypothetical protein
METIKQTATIVTINQSSMSRTPVKIGELGKQVAVYRSIVRILLAT